MPAPRRPLLRALVIALVVIAPALPGVAVGPVSVVDSVVRDVVTIDRLLPDAPARVLSVQLQRHDRLLGVTWTSGNPEVTVRWRSAGGWSRWAEAHSDAAVPNASERRSAMDGTEPVWRPTGSLAAEVQVAPDHRAVTGLRVLAVADVIRRSWSLRSDHSDAVAASSRGILGAVGTRRDWHANESWRRCAPEYASKVRAVIVHHTVQGNDYDRGDVPAMIRADYAYHVKARGWCDLGYNMLVDKFGRVWEGRYGGIGRAVIGAHAQGFNTGTLGVAFLGNASTYRLSKIARQGFARVAAFAASRWGFDPTAKAEMRSGGSPRYRAGRTVRLHRVMGHRDSGRTACPGNELYGDLRSIRQGAAELLDPSAARPRFTKVNVTGNPVHAPAPVVVELGLSRSATWTVTLTATDGGVVAEQTGRGDTARLSWDGQQELGTTGVRLPVLPQSLTWTAKAKRSVNGQTLRAKKRTGVVDVSTPYLTVG